MSNKTEFNLKTLLELTGKLTDLVNLETAFLKQMKVSEIAKIQIEKHDTASALEKQQTALKSDAEIKANLTVAEKEELKSAAVEFDLAIQTYQTELFKAQKVNELVIGKMLEVVHEYVTRNRSYTKAGSKTLRGTELAKNTPAMKFNTQA